ncbi:DISARM system helicase DrmA [Actinocorallia sp. A-T 12471]|uniref:DISARM system helicase DrmA n=1 Tax=Actinocorallia sp. A-T 12471 TaxID=3089813 RepID=UPI0029CF1DB1|nr:DISARM system helicase DrmA [Actinocorallia sp. A-T 12471]MDX6739038.1 DISARM system helicase DrmA [Actinocorallia sp. A-T 12471]
MTVPRFADQTPYPFVHDLDGGSRTVRENLVDILERELLGPIGGPQEVLDGPPDAAYLVGRIAPFKLAAGRTDPGSANSDEADTDVGDAIDADEGRGVPTASSSEDGGTEDQPQQRGLMIPASMGLRFQVPHDLTAFTVTASWGMYQSVPVDPAAADGSRGRRYKRTPIEIPVSIAVADLKAGVTKSVPLKDEIVLRVDRHDDPEHRRLIIEIALCNDRETPRKIPVEAWLYQTRLAVTAHGQEVFLPVSDAMEDTYRETDEELERLNLQYRDRLEFAVGRTCSVDWKVADGARRASAVWTTWLPTCQTPQTTAEEISEALLDMAELAVASREALRSGLSPIVDGYARWLDAEERRTESLPEHLRRVGRDTVDDARGVQEQLSEGLEHLLRDEDALLCFRFMNRVMADQRVHTQIGELRAKNPSLSIEAARAAVLGEDPSRAHSWRTFQLAFILMQLPLLTDPGSARRSGDLAKAQLLFFPTGGGKTEAYLGLAAYTFAIRRRQGRLETPDGPLNGGSGVAVLMRYTLRLLTAQQFQRAAALVCAAELARLASPEVWGDEPFRIGLWVGTDVSPKNYGEAETQLEKANDRSGHRVTVLQIQRCPWCGNKIGPSTVKAKRATRRIHVRCSDELAECPFAEGGTVEEGLPVLTVDEEIYRLTPSFLIATVDKFARLAREGEAASLFGYVSRRCLRHGYVHQDSQSCKITDSRKHPSEEGRPPEGVSPVERLRPPDLIIQDELHLITGALGTTVGLFEVAIDVMAAWRDSHGDPVRPLVVASTATARRASDQVRALYGRGMTIFPPQVLDVGKTFFSKEEPVSELFPGRRYIGISTTGVRLTTAEIRVSEVLMAGAQALFDVAGAAADPYMTLVGYFSSTRELAGMARYLGDDIQTALAKGRPWSPLPRRFGTDYGSLHTAELTSRVSSSDITGTLDQMAVPFDVAFDSAEGRQNLRALRQAGKRAPTREANPYDTILATSMLQVGVDVTRLGLMLVVGQPKNTAEYIQASSRVGRSAGKPGLVVSLGNWARPRDLAHFEQFRHYHETFYAKVEALSVTPFSVTSLERGLDGLLVSAARVRQAAQRDSLSHEEGAGLIVREHAFTEQLINALVERVERASDEDSADRARQQLRNRRDQWEKRRDYLANHQIRLAYERVSDKSAFDTLMISAENVKAARVSKNAPPFTVANSMREVQPEINLLVSPIKENLIFTEPHDAPGWEFTALKEES